MNYSILAFLRQGWLGLPLFLIGLVTLAFSQLEESSNQEDLSASQIEKDLSESLQKSRSLVAELRSNFDGMVANELNELQVMRSHAEKVDSSSGSSIVPEILEAEERFKNRSNSIADSLKLTFSKIEDAAIIFDDLKSDFAGRMEEVRTPLLALRENVEGSLLETDALATMIEGLAKDFSYERNNLSLKADQEVAENPPDPPQDSSVVEPYTPLGRKISSIISANEALPLPRREKIGAIDEVQKSSALGRIGNPIAADEDEIIARLREELDESKNFQTVLSADSAELKTDLRKAYREIVSLQNNLKESQLIIDELEKSKRSLYRTEDGGPATAQTVSKEINRLERELEQARDDLRQSRQSLLLEQQRSNAMISSITTELDRTRRELDYARQQVHSNGANFERLAFLERELSQAKRALEAAQAEPIEPGSEDYVNLQDELRKSLGEIARMQVELSEKDKLQEELLKLKSSMEQMEELPSRSASPAFVNKLLVELNAANAEIERLQQDSSSQRNDLSDDVFALQEKLQKTQQELAAVRTEFAKTKEEIAKREFEFADTIKKLEEESQMAEAVLQQAAEGKIPLVPFVAEMEEDLAASESRIRLLSDQFANEQKKATEVIEELSEELSLAQARHKESLDQLARRELELTSKDQSLDSLNEQKKELEEELEVVKVIAGQLQDLNQVLENTKETQFTQTELNDQAIDSLKRELNRAKVELVVALEEKESLQNEYSDRLKNLEIQLDQVRNEMMDEQLHFQETTNESKVLVEQLRSELDAARKEVSSMKRAGITESIETKQAVAQLQEALGTIRILQESLEDAEASNLEVDNLRAELADAMSGQLNELRESEEEKLALKQKISNLETEANALRQEMAGSRLGGLKSDADSRELLRLAEAEIKELKNRLSQAEESGIESFVRMDDELAEVRNENADLRSEIGDLLKRGVSPSPIQLDEQFEESDDMAKLSKENEALRKQLTDVVASHELEILDLQQKLDLSGEKAIQAKTEAYPSAEMIELKSENMRLRNQLVDHAKNNTKDDESLARKASLLEEKLEIALSKVRELEQRKSARPEVIMELEQDLALSNNTISELNAQIEAMIARQAEAELELAMHEETEQKPPAPLSSVEKSLFEDEIASLKSELNNLRAEMRPQGNSDSQMQDLQEQLRNALADSFELEMELEQTQNRLNEMENQLANQPDQNSFAELRRQAREAEASAQARIDQLSNALRNSEQLRAETEDIVSELEKKATGPIDVTKDPKFVDLQQEMLVLQNDLISLQSMPDSRVRELEDKLAKSKSDTQVLNQELKAVMTEFSALRTSLGSLEEENRKLRDVSLAQARNQADQAGETLQVQINNLARENASLTAQGQEKDRRIQGLRNEIAELAAGSSDDVWKNQISQLQARLQAAEDDRDRVNLESQRIRDELAFSSRNLAALKGQLNDLEQRTPMVEKVNDPVLLTELENLRMQNQNLVEQISTFGSMPQLDELEDRVRNLNQRNLALTVELDQERSVVNDLKDELSDARSIKQEVLERGKSSKLKIDLLNEELSDARNRVTALEKALISAREAIRVLQGGGAGSAMIQVSNPSNFSNNLYSRDNELSGRRYGQGQALPEYTRATPRNFFPPESRMPETVQTNLVGQSNLQVQAKVQFLDNKIRPAGFTEFFLAERDLADILNEEGIKPPTEKGIQSHAEYWARSVQRGYQFPGVAAKIRNALARASLRRIKTNSLGVGNLDGLADGNYFLIGASTLGQVGVVWSKSLNLNDGENIVSLDLKDASWAQ